MNYFKPQPGDSVANTLSAQQMGGWADAAQAARRSPLLAKGGPSLPMLRSSVCVLCKNTDGGNLKSRRAVVLTQPVITPDDSIDEFKKEVVMEVETPGDNALLTWGVLDGQLANNKYGTVTILGDVICWINLLSVSDLYVDVVSGSQTPQSGMYGPAQIVWVKGGLGTAAATGEQWAVICLGGNSPEAGFWAQITANTQIADAGSSDTGSSSSSSASSNRWQYTWQEMQLQQNGVWQVRPGGRTTDCAGYDNSGDCIGSAYAYNTVETNNSETGMQGNSINVDNLPSGFSIQPVQGNPVVFLRPVPNCHVPPVKEYYFEYVNAVDGACAGASSSSSSSSSSSGSG